MGLKRDCWICLRSTNLRKPFEGKQIICKVCIKRIEKLRANGRKAITVEEFHDLYWSIQPLPLGATYEFEPEEWHKKVYSGR